MVSESPQADLFAAPTFDTLSALLGPDGEPPTIVVGCGRRKGNSAAEARALYVSERFQTCRTVAETLSAPFLILSGLHGLVAPDAKLEPYDLNLDTLPQEPRRIWANNALDCLNRMTQGPITLFAAGAYAEAIITSNVNRAEPLPIFAPLTEIEAHHHKVWLYQALADSRRIRDLRRLYLLIDEARREDATFLLENLPNRKLPPRGVYIFLDPAEPNFLGTSPRIVRIGTHAVSTGSKSTLRSRLRNHLGLANGAGNHRGSIFRLHVGRAMLESGLAGNKLPSWGLGQDAQAETRDAEDVHERRVSTYLRRLEVFIIPIADEPSKRSLRAHVESQLIALCSDGIRPIDRPGANWLGSTSPMESIARSGLWNLRDVGRRYEPHGLGSVDHIAALLNA